ncbi:MAG: hypothetical protein JXL97_15500 [Bacteroidales bacterium]|nr:hypothetical protein [Bacteroidales bacterium]
MDTTYEIKEKQREIFFKKTSNERFLIGVDFISMGYSIVESNIKQSNLKISTTNLKIEIFKRYYSNVFSKNEFKKIISEYTNYLKTKEPLKKDENNYNLVAEPETKYQ